MLPIIIFSVVLGLAIETRLDVNAAQATIEDYLIESDPESAPHDMASIIDWCSDADYSAGARSQLKQIDDACSVLTEE